MSDERKVQRLMSGPTLSFFSRSSLWLEEDHLLSVEQRGMHENYRRFYFDDIQALVICRTERRFYVGLVLGIFIGIGLLVMAAGGGSFESKFFGGMLAGFFGILMAVNLFKGPGCVCQLRTSVSVTKLAAVKRLKKLERVLPELSARILERQEAMDPREMSAAFQARQESAAEAAASSARELSVSSLPAGVGPGGYSGNFHLFLFSLLLAEAALVMVAFVGNHPMVVGLRMLVMLGALFCAIVALSRHKKIEIGPSLRVSTIGATVYLAAGAIGMYGLLVTMQVRDPENAGNTVGVLRALAGWSPYEGNFWLLLFVANAAIAGLLGAFGLLHTMSYRAHKGRIEAPPIPSGP